jgi:gas vesicle protein
MKNSGNIFIGIIAAATAGVVIGMLIAPEKGEDLRKNIKDSAGDWTKKINQLLSEGKSQLDRFTSSAEEGFDDLKKDGKASKV